MERSMTTKRIALGKGLGALLPEMGQTETKALLICGVEEIHPNRSQPENILMMQNFRNWQSLLKKKGFSNL